MIGLLAKRREVVCSIHERPDHAAAVEQRADELVFLRDRFSWPVAILPPLALLARGVWVGLLVYLAAVAMAIFALELAGAPNGAYAIALVVIHIVFGFEATALERWYLRAAGWKEVAVVSGADMAECETRFFMSWRPALYMTEPAPAESPRQPTLLRRLFAAAP